MEISKLSDDQLFLLLRDGNKTAYTEIYERYKHPLFIHAYKRIKNREIAQDVVQDLFIKLWDKKDTITLSSGLLPYLYASVRNRIFDMLAKDQLQNNYFNSLQNFIDQGYEVTDHKARISQLMAIVDKEIAQLPEKMQLVFKMSRNEHLSHKEISEILNISEKTVKKHIQNALKILKAKLGPFYILLFL